MISKLFEWILDCDEYYHVLYVFGIILPIWQVLPCFVLLIIFYQIKKLVITMWKDSDHETEKKGKKSGREAGYCVQPRREGGILVIFG